MKPAQDLQINVANLPDEYEKFPSVLYAYAEAKSSASEIFDRMKAELKDIEASVYIEIKSGPEKVTEKNLEALVQVDPRVKTSRQALFKAERDLETCKNYVESLRAKKDMLIQLGADSRKE